MPCKNESARQHSSEERATINLGFSSHESAFDSFGAELARFTVYQARDGCRVTDPEFHNGILMWNMSTWSLVGFRTEFLATFCGVAHPIGRKRDKVHEPLAIGWLLTNAITASDYVYKFHENIAVETPSTDHVTESQMALYQAGLCQGADVAGQRSTLAFDELILVSSCTLTSTTVGPTDSLLATTDDMQSNRAFVAYAEELLCHATQQVYQTYSFLTKNI